jgi:hypothetical protein
MLTALFTSSDRQLDTKERRRYELKLSKAPNMRTVIIAVLAFILIGTAVDALAKELRVVTPENLIQCTKGLPLSAPSPDAGKAAAQGDTCVVLPGTYAVDEPVVIVVENLTLRSSDGPTATLIKGSETALIIIVNRGVTLGGASPNQGFSISNADGVAVCVTELDNDRVRPLRAMTCSGDPQQSHPGGAGVRKHYNPEQRHPRQRARGHSLHL